MGFGISGVSSQNSSLLNLNNINKSISSNITRLSSGIRINKASDDAASAAISAKLTAEIASLEQANRNVGNGESLLNTADSGLNNISNLLVRARELAVQSANGALSNADREIINNEFGAVLNEITRVANTTEFNGQALLNGNLSSGASSQAEIQAGPSGSSSDQININIIEGATASQLGLNSVNVSTTGNAQNAARAIDNAINQISQIRADVGAAQNRLSNTASNLSISIINETSANSAIRDADIGSEISSFTQNQIVQKAAIFAMKQENANSRNLIGQLQSAK